MSRKGKPGTTGSHTLLTYFGAWTLALYVLVGTVVVFTVNMTMREEALHDAREKARIILDRNLATHTYFNKRLKPNVFNVTDNVLSKDYFDPAWMSSTYAIREIDGLFQDLSETGYYYKEAAIDARTTANEANETERRFLNRLNTDTDLQIESGIREIDGRPFFVVLRRGESMDKECLRCHSTPDRAPKGLVDFYGPVRSFNRSVGDVVSAISIRVPLTAAYARVNETSLTLSLVFLGSLGILFGLEIVLSRRLILAPLARLRAATQKVAEAPDKEVDPIPLPETREFQNLTTDFNTMSTKLVESRTEQQRAEDNLAKLHRFLQNIINSMPSLLVGVDAECRITHWNSKAEEMSGVSSDAAHGRTLDELFPHLSADLPLVKSAVAENRLETLSKVAYSTGDDIQYLDIVIYPLISNGVVGAVIRIDDVSERVHIEEMMVQTEKMLSVGGLAAGMAHEINNPLSGILQNLQNVRRRLLTDLPANREVAEAVGIDFAKLQGYLEERNIPLFFDDIARTGERAATIVSNMLQFSRSPGEDKEHVNLNELIDQTFEIANVDYDLKKKYDFRTIVIQRVNASALPPVPCIPSEIQQVLLNIVGNAAQAFKEQEDRSERPRITVRTIRQADMARIEIEDNGPGIDPETQRRVFEPFFTTKPPGQGTGLGLSVSYFIVKDIHDGQISVESMPGGGARFVILLPLN